MSKLQNPREPYSTRAEYCQVMSLILVVSPGTVMTGCLETITSTTSLKRLVQSQRVPGSVLGLRIHWQ